MSLENRLSRVERVARIGEGEQSVRIVTGVPRTDGPIEPIVLQMGRRV